MLIKDFVDRIIVKDNEKRNIYTLHNKQPSLDSHLNNLQGVFREFEANHSQVNKLCYEAILKPNYIAITINKENEFILQSFIDTLPEFKLLSLQDIPFFINGNDGKTCVYRLTDGFDRQDLMKNTLGLLKMKFTLVLPSSVISFDGKKRSYSLVENTGLEITEIDISKENNLLLVNDEITQEEEDGVVADYNDYLDEAEKYEVCNDYEDDKHNLDEFATFMQEKQVSILSGTEYILFLRNGEKVNTENNYHYVSLIRKAFGKDIYIGKDFLENNLSYISVLDAKSLTLSGGKKVLNNKLRIYKVDMDKFLNIKSQAFKQFAIDINTILFLNRNSYNYEYDAEKELYEITNNENGVYINMFNKEIWNKPKELAKEGDWSLIKAHLENLTIGESGVLDYILYLYAFKMQKPNATFDTDTICILDEGGTGKSLLGKILNYIQVGSGEYQLFNKDKTSLIGKRFMYINEMSYNKEFTTELKKATENTIWSEQKFKNPTLIKHSALFHLFSNKANLMDYEESRRRWIMLNPERDSLKPYLQSKFDGNVVEAYLSQLGSIDTNSINLDFIHSQLNAFIHYLLNYDLANKPAKPTTKATEESNNVLKSPRILEYLDEISFTKNEISRMNIDEINSQSALKLKDIIYSKSNRNIDLSVLNNSWEYGKEFKVENNCLVLYIHKLQLIELTKKMFNTNEKTAKNHIKKLEAINTLVSVKRSIAINKSQRDGYLIKLTNSITNI